MLRLPEKGETFLDEIQKNERNIPLEHFFKYLYAVYFILIHIEQKFIVKVYEPVRNDMFAEFHVAEVQLFFIPAQY